MAKKKQTPPKLAVRFLNWFLRDDLAEEVLGDLEEQFYNQLKNNSLFRARLNYWFQVINYLRPFAISKSSTTLLINQGMFRNYFKISIRNLSKQKLYAAINIGGLAVGLTCFILIFLFVQHELSFNSSFANADHIYRIIYQDLPDDNYHNSGGQYSAYTPSPLASTLVQEFPEIELATTINNHPALLGISNKDFSLQHGLLADSSFLEIFDFPFIQGNPGTALDQPNTIVLTQSLASKLFADANPLGQTIIYRHGKFFGTHEVEQKDEIYLVTGVVEDPPPTISFRFSFIASILSHGYTSWESYGNNTFLLLPKSADPLALQEKLPAALAKFDESPGKYIVQPFKEIYLQTGVRDNLGPNGNPKYIYLFSAIALIVLLLACANYMNLAIARSAGRAREVGLRKAVGAVRMQLIIQFLGESILLAFIALLLAVGLTYLTLPVFADIIERTLTLDFIGNSWLIPGLLVLVLLVGLISGSYPALYMSSLRPYKVLKGKIENRASGFGLQKFLIVFQYTVSVILIIGSIVIYRQLQYMQNKELGYDKEHVLTIAVRDNNVRNNFDEISNELLQYPQITAITKSDGLPTNITRSGPADFDGDGKIETNIHFSLVYYDFLKVFGLQLVAGRDFSPEFPGDMPEATIINEAAAKAWGYTPEEAIGKELGSLPVIGVAKDFHMHSMHTPIQPLRLILHYARGNFISLKVRPERIAETVALVEKTFKKHSDFPFEYSFLDDRFDQLYKSEMKLGKIFGFFTIMAILLAALGVFGMAAFSTIHRTKEIGIRKVLGASVRSIVLLLSRDFLILVVVAFFIALPIGWYAIYQWLQDFAYRINIDWWMFALAGILILTIAYLAVGYQSIKAAFVNPVDSLRSE